MTFVFPIAMLLIEFLLTALTLLFEAFNDVDSTTYMAIIIPRVKTISGGIIKA